MLHDAASCYFKFCLFAVLIDTNQVSVLRDLKEFTDEIAKEKKVKFKNMSDRRKYVKGMGLKIVKDPRSKKDAVPIHDKTLMLSGHRVATERSREEEHEDRRGAKEAFEEARKQVDVGTNSKARALPCCHIIVI